MRYLIGLGKKFLASFLHSVALALTAVNEDWEIGWFNLTNYDKDLESTNHHKDRAEGMQNANTKM
jgi:hypothetical protein